MGRVSGEVGDTGRAFGPQTLELSAASAGDDRPEKAQGMSACL